MTRLMLSCAFTTCAVLAIGCGNGRTAKSNENTGANAPAADQFRGKASDRPAPVDVSGCLTAAGDRYVLTSLEPVAPRGASADRNTASAPGAPAVPTTDTYQLIGGSPADLHQYVGQQVRVTGEADPAGIAELRESTPPVGTSGAQQPPAAGQPKVSTEETTRLELRKLRVSSITGAGGPCAETRPAPAR